MVMGLGLLGLGRWLLHLGTTGRWGPGSPESGEVWVPSCARCQRWPGLRGPQRRDSWGPTVPLPARSGGVGFVKGGAESKQVIKLFQSHDSGNYEDSIM